MEATGKKKEGQLEKGKGRVEEMRAWKMEKGRKDGGRWWRKKKDKGGRGRRLGREEKKRREKT